MIHMIHLILVEELICLLCLKNQKILTLINQNLKNNNIQNISIKKNKKVRMINSNSINLNNKIISIKRKNNLINIIIIFRNKINNNKNNNNSNKSNKHRILNKKMKSSNKKEIQYIFLIQQNTIILQTIFQSFIKNLAQQKTFIVI